MNFAALQHALDWAAATVWRNSAEATGLIVLVAAVQFLFRRGLPPRWRYALGLLVVIRQALPTAMPDDLLHTLMQDLLTAENKLVALRSEYGESHPDVVRTRNMVKDLNTKIDDRVEGIMIGADMLVASLRAASDSTREKLKTARLASQDALSVTQSFNEFQHELEFLQKSQDSLKLRLQELRIEKAVNNRTDAK